jgi:hypothetical protein
VRQNGICGHIKHKKRAHPKHLRLPSLLRIRIFLPHTGYEQPCTIMLTHFYPVLATLPPFLRMPLDLFCGFALVYLFRSLFTSFQCWRLIRHHSTQLAGPAPVLRLHDVPGPSPPSWLWGSEWEMYSAEPGQKYLEWYERFGRIVRFKGVLGVSGEENSRRNVFLLSCTLLTKLHPVYISFSGRPLGNTAHSGSSTFLHVSQAGWRTPVLPDPPRQRNYLGGRGSACSPTKDSWPCIQVRVDFVIRRVVADPKFLAKSQQALRSLSPIFFDSAYKTAKGWNACIDAAPGDSVEIDVQRWANHIS